MRALFVGTVLILFLSQPAETLRGAEATRSLFNFAASNASGQWQTVNDGVMGGRSSGRFSINSQGHLEFFGNLSLANNGGFASVRSRTGGLGLKSGDTIEVKFRGDGRKYSVNLYPRRQRTAFSYRVMFQTQPDEWMIVKIPLSMFRATSFGRTLSNQTLNPSDIGGIGFLLGDKKPGPFKLEVASIRVISPE